MRAGPPASPRDRARQATIRAVTLLVIGSFSASAPVGVLFPIASADPALRPSLPPGAGPASDFTLLLIGPWFPLTSVTALVSTLFARHRGDHVLLLNGCSAAMMCIGFFLLGSILGYLAYRRPRRSREEWRRE